MYHMNHTTDRQLTLFVQSTVCWVVGRLCCFGESLIVSKQLGLRGKQFPCIWAMHSEQNVLAV